jgi:hypothetical protein
MANGLVFVGQEAVKEKGAIVFSFTVFYLA